MVGEVGEVAEEEVEEPGRCPQHGSFPTAGQLLEGLGSHGFGLLLSSSVFVLLLNIFMLAILVRKFLKTVPASQLSNLLWVNSLFCGISLTVVLLVVMPQATEFLLAAFRVYEAMVICRFVELHLQWCGGEKQLMAAVGPSPIMRYNLPPCCCLLVCLRRVELTRERLRMVRAMVRQMAYVQLAVLFFQQVALLSRWLPRTAGVLLLRLPQQPAGTGQPPNLHQAGRQDQLPLRPLRTLLLLHD